MYRLGQRHEKKRPSKLRRLLVFLIFLSLFAGAAWYLWGLLKPETTFKQAAPKITKLDYNEDSKTRVFDESNFSIELPLSWQKQPKPANSYNSFVWKNINTHQNSEEITVYEDKIPAKYAVNKVIIVKSQGSQLTQEGDVSENCSKYTKSSASYENVAGAPARWEGVDFLCDQANKTRDVIGTSSIDGINTVVLNGSNGAHKYFFTYTNNSITGNYVTFTDMLRTFRMK